MSIRLMSAIFESQTLAPTERLVMLALADHADDDGRCYPSIERLCQRTGLSERAVRGNLRKLEGAGYLRTEKGGGRGGTSLYFVSANPAGNAPLNDVKGAAGAPGSKCPPAAGAGETGQQVPVKGAAGAPEPSRNTIEPSEETPCGSPPEKPPRRRAAPIPPGWVPSERNLQDAFSRNFTEQEISHEAERFRDHHLAKGTLFKDWDAGWRTWLGNARRFAAGRGTSGGSHASRGERPGGIVGAAMRGRSA